MATTPTQDEMTKAHDWFASSFTQTAGEQSKLPLSFRLADVESTSFLNTWKALMNSDGSDKRFTRYTVTLSDPNSDVELQCDIRLFNDFPAVEWVGYFKNNGTQDSAIISDIQALESVFSSKPENNWLIHYAKGSDYRIDDFQPQEYVLRGGEHLDIRSSAGRSSDGGDGGSMPFFNAQVADSGVIGAVGWTGDWAVKFTREGLADGGLCVRAGMKKTHLKLYPGEEIRTPKMLLMFWDGDYDRAHNLWRQLILTHYRPTVNGAPAQAPLCTSAWGEVLYTKNIEAARWWHDNNIPTNTFWIDAGWYGDAEVDKDSTVITNTWAIQVGNWWPHKTLYPNGLKPVGDALKKMGLGFVLWFEPERANKGTALTREHPEWLLGPVLDSRLFNLAIPEAREYLIDLISSYITEGSVTIYRQDFNMGASPFWELVDTPNRVGISEIRHIEGLYAFWDALLARHPGLLIDNCSSGGRRIDIETISRSIPLWRSDFQCFAGFNPTGMQGQTQGLASWVPLSTGACDRKDNYAYRSAFGPGIVINDTLPHTEESAEWLRNIVHEECEVSKYFYGDFYPLLAYSTNDDVWAMWQYDRPDLGEGVLLAFRRQLSPFAQVNAQFRTLDPDASYELQSFDGGEPRRFTGREMMEQGLSITINEKPGSVIFIYRRLD